MSQEESLLPIYASMPLTQGRRHNETGNITLQRTLEAIVRLKQAMDNTGHPFAHHASALLPMVFYMIDKGFYAPSSMPGAFSDRDNRISLRTLYAVFFSAPVILEGLAFLVAREEEVFSTDPHYPRNVESVCHVFSTIVGKDGLAAFAKDYDCGPEERCLLAWEFMKKFNIMTHEAATQRLAGLSEGALTPEDGTTPDTDKIRAILHIINAIGFLQMQLAEPIAIVERMFLAPQPENIFDELIVPATLPDREILFAL